MNEVVLAVMATIAPACVIALVLRRWFDELPWSVVVAGLLLTFAFIAPGLHPDALPVPVDEVTRGYPHLGVVGPHEARNGITNDTVKLFYPWMHAVREAYAAGEWPLWNHAVFAGYPLLANGESAPFSPFFIVTLFVPLARQVVAMAALKIFVAFLFTWLLCRRCGLSAAAAAFAAVAFAFSVYQTVYLYYSAATVSALLPAAAYAATVAVRTRQWRFFALFIGAVAALMNGGHPESVVHVAIGCAIVLAVEFSRSTDRRAWFRGFAGACVATVLALALSAPGWVPVLELVTESARLAEVRGDRVMTEPFNGNAAWTLVNPDAFGNPARGTWSWIYNYPVVATSYAGLAVLALLPVALTVPGRARWWAIAAILTFLAAMNWGPVGAINSVPPLSLIANDKMRFVTVFLAALAAGAALDRLRERRLLFVTSVAIVLVPWGMVYLKFHARHFGNWALAGAIGCVAIAVSLVPRLTRFVPAIAVVAIVADLFAFNHAFNAPAPRSHFMPPLPIVDAARAAAPPEPYRITGLDWTFLPNTPSLYGFSDVRGSDPMAWAPYYDVLKLVSVDTPGADVRRTVDLSSKLFDFLNVRFAFCPPETGATGRWVVAYSGPDGVLLENTAALQRFFVPERLRPLVSHAPPAAQLAKLSDPGREVFVEGLAVDRRNGRGEVQAIAEGVNGVTVTVEASEPLLLASSTPAHRGWRAEVNGRDVPVVTVNGAFAAVHVDRGRSTVRLRYMPESFLASMWVAAGTLLALTVAAVWRRRRLRASLPPA